jgi:hypothetical protein
MGNEVQPFPRPLIDTYNSFLYNPAKYSGLPPRSSVSWRAEFLRECFQLKLVEGILEPAHVELCVSKPHSFDASQSVESCALVSCCGRPAHNVILVASTTAASGVVIVGIIVIVDVIAPDGVNAFVVLAATIQFDVFRTPCFRNCP